MKIKLLLLISAFSLLLAACRGAAAAPAGDPEAGRQLFQSTAIGPAPGCATCHSTAPSTVIVGPSLAGVASRAGQRIPGVTAADYVRQSILEPNSHVVDGFQAGVMYQNFQEVLTEAQLDDLVAFLLTLE